MKIAFRIWTIITILSLFVWAVAEVSQLEQQINVLTDKVEKLKTSPAKLQFSEDGKQWHDSPCKARWLRTIQ